MKEMQVVSDSQDTETDEMPLEMPVPSNVGLPFISRLPRGKKQTVYIKRPEELQQQGRNFRRLGGWFEMERLPDYIHISLSAWWKFPEGPDDIATEVVRDEGLEIFMGVDRLIAKVSGWMSGRQSQGERNEPA